MENVKIFKTLNVKALYSFEKVVKKNVLLFVANYKRTPKSSSVVFTRSRMANETARRNFVANEFSRIFTAR